MDAMSRPIIWEILERVKCNGRTLVLTTHHLDEAEILADRIAIMAAGKLLACGKSDYIKVNFGEGY
jgi:ABC-type multidrug transport system ATPase subunit